MTKLSKKITGTLAAAILSASALTLSLPAQVQAAEGGHILAHVMPTDHIFNSVSEQFISKLDELSGGSVKIEYHPGGDLGDWGTITEQVMVPRLLHRTGTHPVQRICIRPPLGVVGDQL